MFWGGDKEGVESQKKRRKNKIEGEGGKKDEAEGGGRGQWQQWGGGTISNLESLEWIVLCNPQHPCMLYMVQVSYKHDSTDLHTTMPQ